MTKQKLLELMINIPDNALIYIESDHGQTPEQAYYVNITTDTDLEYYSEDTNWSNDIESVDINSITAILIS